MTRYHINDAGNPGQCEAKIKCRFGDLETEHYGSREEAAQAYEEKQEKEIQEARKALDTLNKLEGVSRSLTKNSDRLRQKIEATEKIVKVASNEGNLDSFEKHYNELKKLEAERKEVETKRKEVASIISKKEELQKSSSQKTTAAQLRIAEDKTLETRAKLIKDKSKLQAAEKKFNSKIASRADISELKPLMEELKILQDQVEQSNSDWKKATSELSKLKKAEPKRKKSNPEVKTLKKSSRSEDYYNYNCGGYGSGRC